MTTPRVVLLLDLDCFYAQCECIRLGYDATTTPLALMQWNSCLAVTYPARQFQIQRGDGWDVIAQKHKDCLVVHVPVLTQNNSYDSSQEYESIFNLSKEEQLRERQKSIGKRYSSSSGKACIERYRIASARIFETVLEYTDKRDIILERASIDEFFLDVTKACTADSGPTDMGKTVIVGDVAAAVPDPYFQRGAVIAQEIRQRIREKLGFTLSAGIGPNKTIAKLTATYGKPNGQAITFPSALPYLLERTPIKDCRNLGGKIGKTVMSLLPEDKRTLLDLQSLSIPELSTVLDVGTANSVYQLARGIDNSPVVPKNESAVTKSLTAFKSLPYTKDGSGHPIDTIGPWLKILAQEIVSRVERDSNRNDRYPRTCTVQWAQEHDRSDRTNFHKNKSARFPFPSERMSIEDKIEELCKKAPESIKAKEGPDFRVHRFGLCAVDFQSREGGQQGIDQFLKEMTKQSNEETKKSPIAQKRKVEEACDSVDADLELAKKLQAEFDRENRVHEVLDRRKKAKATGPKISSFFQKR